MRVMSEEGGMSEGDNEERHSDELLEVGGR